MTSTQYEFVRLDHQVFSADEMRARAKSFRAELEKRRSVRHFTDEVIPMDVLEECILTAGSAPSGAHRQPWTFVVVTDADVKRKIRLAAEDEEKVNYGGRMNEEWLRALEPLGTTWEKPFLETAPALIVVFRHAWGEVTGERVQNYYTQESVGIACGFLLAALHHAGLATLTHTPSPMGFLGEVLGRPEQEKAFLLIPVGFPTSDCEVPKLARKSLDEIIERK